MRLWRKSLAAQFIGFMLAALIVSQTIAFLISWDERTSALRAAAKSEFYSRAVSMTGLLQSIPPASREQALHASETTYSRFWLTDSGPGEARAWRLEALDQLSRPLDNFIDLSDQYHWAAPAKPKLPERSEVASENADEGWVSPPPAVWSLPQTARFIHFDRRKGLGIMVELGDGQWLNFASYQADSSRWWNSRSLTSVGLAALLLALIGALISHRIASLVRSAISRARRRRLAAVKTCRRLPKAAPRKSGELPKPSTGCRRASGVSWKTGPKCWRQSAMTCVRRSPRCACAPNSLRMPRHAGKCWRPSMSCRA
ncbi:UNVERIFIED_ORG: hypothetical protein BCL66_10684 [Martelella mediterranea]